MLDFLEETFWHVCFLKFRFFWSYEYLLNNFLIKRAFKSKVTAPMVQWARASAPQAEGKVFESQLKKQVVISPLLKARQKVWVSWVLGDDHYKRIPLVTVGVTRKRTLTAQWPWVPSIGQNLQPITGNGDVSLWMKNSQVGR